MSYVSKKTEDEVDSISTIDFEEYTFGGDAFSVEGAAKHFNVSKQAIRIKSSSLGYSQVKGRRYEMF